MTTPNIDEPKTISEVLFKLFDDGRIAHIHDLAPSEYMHFIDQAKAEVSRIMEDVIGPDAENIMNRALQEDQRQRLKERL